MAYERATRRPQLGQDGLPRAPIGSTGMGKVVLVTGASSGIGQATANRLVTSGWTVVGASRRGTGGPGWEGVVMDVDDDASVRSGVEAVVAKHGRVDAAVTCAGWGLCGAAETTVLDEARAQVDTNFWGTVRVVQAVLPHMRAQGDGRLVLLGSIGGVIGVPFQAFYSASKFALEGFGEALAYEVEPFGVSVSIVEPGNAKTGFTASRRVSGPPPGQGPYGAAAAKAIAVMERDEQNGPSPVVVAKVITRVLRARKPPRRASAGKAGERIGLVGKRILPFRVFQAAARSALGV